MMKLQSFIEQVCKDGLASAENDHPYKDDALKLVGYRDGYQEALRYKTPQDLYRAWERSNRETQDKFSINKDSFWYHRSKTSALDWVCNCVAAYQKAHNKPVIGVMWPSTGAWFKAAQILELRYPEKVPTELFYRAPWD